MPAPQLAPSSLPLFVLFYSPLYSRSLPSHPVPVRPPGTPAAKAVWIALPGDPSAQGSPPGRSSAPRELRHNGSQDKPPTAPARPRALPALAARIPPPLPASRRQPPHRAGRRPGTGRSGTARRAAGNAPAPRAPSGRAGPAAAAPSPCGASGRREPAALRPGPRLPGRLRVVRGAVRTYGAGPRWRGGKRTGWCWWRRRRWGEAGESGRQLRDGRARAEGTGAAAEGRSCGIRGGS